MVNTLKNIHVISGYSNSFVLEFDDYLILIDCGFDKKAKEIIKKIKKVGKNLRYIFITHSHIDHIYGLYEIFRKFPSAKIVAHKNSEKYLVGKEFKLPKGIKGFVFKFFVYFLNYRGFKPHIKIYNEIEELNGIKAIYTPGHTEDHVCYLVADKLFIGDLIINKKGLSLAPKEYNDSEIEIKKSIEKLLKLDFNEIYFGHGETLSTNAKIELENFYKKLYYY
ncbi:MAG: MBL fold metallo-hydrolase [Nanopusillaceae archaeon]